MSHPSSHAQACANVVLHSSLFKKDFYDWLKANGPIFEYFENCAIKIRENGTQHFGAKAIVEVMRYRTAVREIGDGKWKLNNNRTSDMAKLYLLLHPEHDGLFEVRGKKAA